MYAILESGGFQFSVKEGEKVRIPRLQIQPKEKVTFDKVLFIGGDSPLVGSPYVEKARVEGEVVGWGKDDKITVCRRDNGFNLRRNGCSAFKNGG